MIITEFVHQLGYVGVFFTSLAGSVVPFLPVAYLIVVILLSGRLDSLALGVVAGVGGALGKATSSTSYGSAWRTRAILASPGGLDGRDSARLVDAEDLVGEALEFLVVRDYYHLRGPNVIEDLPHIP